MSIALVTDSTCDLPGDIVADLGARVVPLYVLFGEESIKQSDIDPDTFYKRQREAQAAVKTSQPTPTDFAVVYKELLDKGAETIISIHLSAETSGTMRSALAARDEIKGERGDVDIRIIDSRNVCLGLGIIVIEAGQMIRDGKNADEIEKAVRDLIPRIHLIFYVGGLEYLHKGGRIGLAKALLGALLSLKIVLHFKDGVVQPLMKGRKKAKLFKQMSDLLVKEREGVGEQQKMFIAHGDSPEEFDAIKAVLPDEVRGKIVTARVGGVVGCHSGPDVVGLAYVTK